VSFIVCVVLCAVFRLIMVLFCVMCVICLLCLILLPLPPGKNLFAVKINNNNINIIKCEVVPVLKYKLRHEGVRGSGCIDPRFLDLGVSWRGVVSFTLRPLSPSWKKPPVSIG
jgi:hypothetical protein